MKKDIQSVYAGAGILFYGVFLGSAFSSHLLLAGAAGVLLAVLAMTFLVTEEGFTVRRALGTALAVLSVVVTLMVFLAVSAANWQIFWVPAAMMFLSNVCVVLGVVMTIVNGSIYMAAEDPDFTPPTLL